MTAQRAQDPTVPFVSQVKSPPPTAESEKVMDEYKKALEGLAAYEAQAREVSKRAGAELVRRKSMPQMKAQRLIPLPTVKVR